MPDHDEDLQPDVARERLVDLLTKRGFLTRPDVTAAFRTVPRELFAPAGTGIQAAYADDAVITRRGADGKATSSVSAPWLSLSTLIVLQSP